VRLARKAREEVLIGFYPRPLPAAFARHLATQLDENVSWYSNGRRQ
jgi:hypothetical protein